MEDNVRTNRYRLDMMTNPAYVWLKGEIQQMRDKELRSLQAAGRREAEFQFNHQTGVVDGIERVQGLMNRLEEEARAHNESAE